VPDMPVRLELDDHIHFGPYEFQVKSANLNA